MNTFPQHLPPPPAPPPFEFNDGGTFPGFKAGTGNQTLASFKRRHVTPAGDLDREEMQSGNRQFRDALIQPPKGIYMDDAELDDEAMDVTGLQSKIDADGRICIQISGSRLRKLHRPWSKALILRVLGKEPLYHVFRARLEAQWGLIKGFELTDLAEGCFCVRFYQKEDYERVLLEGPWMVQGNYVTVQTWSPNFDPSVESTRSTPVWIRLRGVPMEYYEEDILMDIGHNFGRAIKVDPATLSASRGKFARICVELNLNHSLAPAIWVNGRKFLVEYEGLHLICFECGTYGHRKENCGRLRKDPVASVPDVETGIGQTAVDGMDTRETTSPATVILEEKAESQFGPWMIAARRKKKMTGWIGSVDKGKKIADDVSAVGDHISGMARFNLGSRFDVLGQDGALGESVPGNRGSFQGGDRLASITSQKSGRAYQNKTRGGSGPSKSGKSVNPNLRKPLGEVDLNQFPALKNFQEGSLAGTQRRNENGAPARRGGFGASKPRMAGANTGGERSLDRCGGIFGSSHSSGAGRVGSGVGHYTENPFTDAPSSSNGAGAGAQQGTSPSIDVGLLERPSSQL